MGLALINRLCDVCKHRHHGTHPPTCEAFPERIPIDVRLMYADHRLPYPGDGGIRFEPADDTPATAARLAKVVVRASAVSAELHERISVALPMIPFETDAQKWQFQRVVARSSAFEQLPDWCRQLVLAAERQSRGSRSAPT